MNQEAWKNDWSRVQEIFGGFCRPQRLALEARQGFSKDGRGVLFFYMAYRYVVCTYACLEWINDSIDEGLFKDTLLQAVVTYNPQTQAIILVSFDDLFLSETMNYQWFSIDLL